MESKEKTKQHFNETAADYNNSNDGKFVTPMYEDESINTRVPYSHFDIVREYVQGAGC